ncbi:hypothetical protein F5141DRAFT_1188201 [Pisolithus sp. B1]|nr:hypothetical protein F5141DRAFT_1188201 [Pisolithus sp. B1]
MSSPHNSPFSAARPSSRSSSRNSVRSARAPSPASLNDTVAIRNQVSTLKHSIRQQQAQLHSLENVILHVLDISHPPVAYNNSFSTPKMQRRSSFDVLQGLAGPESNLPLPKRESITPILKVADGIREGIPLEFGGGSPHRDLLKRISSPTRTLSLSAFPRRFPPKSILRTSCHSTLIGNARALAEDGPSPNRISPSGLVPTDGSAANDSLDLNASTSSLQAPATPNRRISLTPGGTTKVLADLQAGVVHARNALENTRAQLRLSQRTVAQLTRQTEDLKESRERLRLENEGLNNVVARKERLLQEVLERARKAEAEATTLRSQLKTETATSKKALREMEAALTESTALSQKCEREYITLRDSIKSMTESWKHDTDRLRDEMRKREDKLKLEAESTGKKYAQLVEEVKAAQEQQILVKDLREESSNVRQEVEDEFREEIKRLKGQVESHSRQSDEAVETARMLSTELARLRRLMQIGTQPPQSYDDCQDTGSTS